MLSNKEILLINSLGSTIQDGNGGYVIGAQYLAIKSINNDSSILSNYKLKWNWANVDNSKTTAIEKSILYGLAHPNIISSNKEIFIPVILGSPTSSLSIASNPILASYNFAQISSAATSIQLKDRTAFPTFYRTVPSDDIQSQCIISMCQQFNWTKIAILYYNDAYGTYLTNSILRMANDIGIKSHSISYVANNQSIENAANIIKNLQLYIIVLIPQNWAKKATFAILDSKGLMQFPYFYIGVDSWFDSQRIVNSNIQRYTKGFVGTTPWFLGNTQTLYQEYKKHGLGQIYNASVNGYNKLQKLWIKEYKENSAFRDLLANDELDSVSYHVLYGWDSAFALINALDIYDKTYNLSTINENRTVEEFSNSLQNIMKSNWFLGVTGNVSFDKTNGDRTNAMYSFSNVIDNNGTVQSIAFYYNGSVYGDFSKITWPNAFNQYGIQPQSNKLVRYEPVHIDVIVQFIIIALSYCSMIIVMVTLIATFKWRKNPIIKAASWKLNMITCIGCLLTYTTIILYGLHPNALLCNLREWLFSISFTLIFMPLFMKSYRVALIFTSGLNGLNVTVIQDGKLVLYILFCLLLDILILGTFTGIEYKQVKYSNHSTQEIHALLDCVKVLAVCSKSEEITWASYVTLNGWKLIQLLFGVYVVIVVSSIGVKRISILRNLKKLNETTSQLIGIIFTILVLLIGSIPLLFRGYNDDTEYYLILGILALLTGNVLLIVNMFPRLYAVWHNDEYKYNMTQQDSFKVAMQKEIKQKGEDYIKEIYFQSRNQNNLYSLSMMKQDMGFTSQRNNDIIYESPINEMELIALEAARSKSLLST